MTTKSFLTLASALFACTLASGAMAQTVPDTDRRGDRLGQIFTQVDANKDGKVTQAELAAQRTAMFATADTNGDGFLAADELAARELARFTESLSARTTRMLARQDADGNGRLSADEIGDGPLERRFALIDADDDGAISQAELESASSRLADHRAKRKHGTGGDWFN